LFHITGDIHYAVLALPKSRTVLTIHDCSLLKKNRHRPLRFALFWTLWYYLPIRRAVVTTVVSEKTRQELIRYVGRLAHSVHVIPNGHDPAFMFQPSNFRYHQPVLLQVGTAPNKNLARLLAAIEGITCKLIIVGPLTELVENDLKKRKIDYQNFVNLTRSMLVKLYKDCDIVTFISTYEGFGMPIIEANAVGRAVITSAISPLYELASGAAHFVDSTNPTSIRQGILKLIQDDEYREQLIIAGRRNAEQYAMEKIAAKYMAIYNQGMTLAPLF
jgi:glycosyltransferase involved in cell wall biosynthesis